jgi:hypothetical protein
MAEQTQTGTAQRQELTGARWQAHRAFNYLALLFIVGVFVQVYLAGVGIFGYNATDLDKASSFDPHRALGEILGLVAVIMLILSLIARRSRDLMIGSLVLALLIEIAQHALATPDHKWVGGLHALDGLIILGLAGWLYHSSRDY